MAEETSILSDTGLTPFLVDRGRLRASAATLPQA